MSPWDNVLAANLPYLCSVAPKDYFISQLYLLFVLLVLFVFSWSSRRQPFTSNEGNHVFIATALVVPIFALSIVLCEQFSDELPLSNVEATRNAMHRDIINAVCMIYTSFATLLAIFGPLLCTIHKYGVLPRKAASYADSLSTAFTVFRGGTGLPGEPILSPDACSQHSSRSNSTAGSGSPARRAAKHAKRVGTGPVFSSLTNSYNYSGGLNSNFRLSPRMMPLDYTKRSYSNFSIGGTSAAAAQIYTDHYKQETNKSHLSPSHSSHHLHHHHSTHHFQVPPIKTRNPLYVDNAQYRSAYP